MVRTITIFVNSLINVARGGTCPTGLIKNFVLKQVRVEFTSAHLQCLLWVQLIISHGFCHEGGAFSMDKPTL